MCFLQLRVVGGGGRLVGLVAKETTRKVHQSGLALWILCTLDSHDLSYQRREQCTEHKYHGGRTHSSLPALPYFSQTKIARE